MNKDIAKKWIEALRSGKYKQGKSFLHNKQTDEMCCLGVLCSLAAEEGITKKFLHPTGLVYCYGDSDADCGKGNVSALPLDVQKWAGMESHIGRLSKLITFQNEIVCGNLAEVNDRTEATFAEIADIIEENMEDL